MGNKKLHSSRMRTARSLITVSCRILRMPILMKKTTQVPPSQKPLVMPYGPPKKPCNAPPSNHGTCPPSEQPHMPHLGCNHAHPQSIPCMPPEQLLTPPVFNHACPLLESQPFARPPGEILCMPTPPVWTDRHL